MSCAMETEAAISLDFESCAGEEVAAAFVVDVESVTSGMLFVGGLWREPAVLSRARTYEAGCRVVGGCPGRCPQLGVRSKCARSVQPRARRSSPHATDRPPTMSAKTKKAKKARELELCSVEEHAFRSESMLKAEDYAGAELEAERALYALPLMARAALTRGRALLHPALTKMVEEGELPSMELLDDIKRAFMLSATLDPECKDTKDGLESLQRLLVDTSRHPPPVVPASAVVGNSAAAAALDVIIVGAGAAGVGTALMLTKTFGLEASRVLLIERGEAVGETFRRWPSEMRFISVRQPVAIPRPLAVRLLPLLASRLLC